MFWGIAGSLSGGPVGAHSDRACPSCPPGAGIARDRADSLDRGRVPRNRERNRTMPPPDKVALVTGAGTGVGRAAGAGARPDRVRGRSRRPADGAARGNRRHGGTGRPNDAGGRLRSRRAGRYPSPVRADGRSVRTARPPVQQRRHEPARRRHGGPAARRLATDRRHQPHRRVPLRAGSHPHHEAPDPERRADRQQRLDRGPCAEAEHGRLHRDEARDHRAHQESRPRRARARHRLQPDRHRQCGDADDGKDEGGHTATGRAGDGRSRCSTSIMWATRWPASPPCRSTRTCSS